MVKAWNSSYEIIPLATLNFDGVLTDHDKILTAGNKRDKIKLSTYDTRLNVPANATTFSKKKMLNCCRSWNQVSKGQSKYTSKIVTLAQY